MASSDNNVTPAAAVVKLGSSEVDASIEMRWRRVSSKPWGIKTKEWLSNKPDLARTHIGRWQRFLANCQIAVSQAQPCAQRPSDPHQRPGHGSHRLKLPLGSSCRIIPARAFRSRPKSSALPAKNCS